MLRAGTYPVAASTCLSESVARASDIASHGVRTALTHTMPSLGSVRLVAGPGRDTPCDALAVGDLSRSVSSRPLTTLQEKH